MTDNLAEIIGYLDIQDELLDITRRDVIDLCRSKEGAETVIFRLQSKEKEYCTDVRLLDKIPLCSLLLAYAYYKWEAYPLSASCTRQAVNNLKTSGHRWNYAMALWARAVVYQENHHLEDAQTDVKDALKILNELHNDFERKSQTKKRNYCGQVRERVKDFANRLKDHSRDQAPAQVTTEAKHKSPPSDSLLGLLGNKPKWFMMSMILSMPAEPVNSSSIMAQSVELP